MIGDRYRRSLEVHGPAVYHGKHSRYLVSIKMCKVPKGQLPRLYSDFPFHKICVLSQHTYPHMHINANLHTYANTERCKQINENLVLVSSWRNLGLETSHRYKGKCVDWFLSPSLVGPQSDLGPFIITNLEFTTDTLLNGVQRKWRCQDIWAFHR